MSKELEIAVVQEPVALAAPQEGKALAQRTVGGSMTELLFMAVERGTPVAELKELVALHEQMSNRQAQQDFAAAMAAFQAECPSIKKSSVAKFETRGGGKMQYTFAALDEIAATVNPILAKHGLSYNWDATVNQGSLTCVCTVRHANGYSTASTITLPTASPSAMSDQQKVGSALTFARRLSLTSALGLTSTDEDHDGRDDNTSVITEDQADTLASLAEEVNVNMPRFLAYLGVDDLKNCPVAKYADAVRTLEKRRSAK